ncbi:MAG: LytTR family transcriptional regulator [Alphaproteobacteria bacterium]|nr:LytTR family transcriptional regulator [Alphaproteobacteria bacterium]
MAWTKSQEIALGFVYWLTFLLALEPGNIARALDLGFTPAWDKEVLRIVGASLLGATSTPLLLALMRHFPIEGGKLWRHATIHSLGGAGIAFGLIAVSCLLAAWFKIGDSNLWDQIAANWLLLVFCIAGFTAIAHAVRFFRRAEANHRLLAQFQTAPSPPSFLSTVQVKARGHIVVLEIADIDWVETQGNYLALHTAGGAHLIRETLSSFEPKLNPQHFARIHRRALVALDRIRAVTPLANGDATVTLTNGAELKLSRLYREKLRAALDGK